MKTIMACVATAVAAIAGGCLMPGNAQRAEAQMQESRPAKPSVAGTWHGTINRPPIGEIRLELRIKESDGVLSGELFNADQAVATPLADVMSDSATLTFAIPATRAGFSGKWDATAEAWIGTYTHPAGNSAATFTAGPTPPLAPLPAVAGLDGRWEGLVQGMAPIVLRIETNSDGTRAWADAPPQAAGMPVRSLTRDGSRVTFGLPQMLMSFDG